MRKSFWIKLAMVLFVCQLSAVDANKERIAESIKYPTRILNPRETCDLEMLICGGFAPLQGYMNQADYLSVVENMRLEDGSVWPIPVTLSIPAEQAEEVGVSGKLTLKDEHGNPLALLAVEEIYTPDIDRECEQVFGTRDRNHPYVNILQSQKNVVYVGGKIEIIGMPFHADFKSLRRTPAETREMIAKSGTKCVVGFQTRNALHRAHIELIQRAALEADPEGKAHIFLHPVVGFTQPGDLDYHMRVRCYQLLLKYFKDFDTSLSLLPLSMRMAGPREALWHAIIRKTYGCTHFIVGRDHAGPSSRTADGDAFYEPYAAQELVEQFADEIGIRLIKSREIVYVKELGEYLPRNEVPSGMQILNISGSEFRKALRDNKPIPEWFSYTDIIDELRGEYRENDGFCIYFTGLPGSGKSALCQALEERLREIDRKRRPITILDADVIRRYISNGLGFSRKDRSINVRRIGYVASLAVKHGGACLCANIAPYAEDRTANRDLISQFGKYIEVYVKTPLEVCEKRDLKGIYLAARQGKIKEFTGISDPYEVPSSPDIVIDSSSDLEGCVEELVDKLQNFLDFGE